MAFQSYNVVTLSSLPLDIVHHIAKLNAGENMHNLRLISPFWNIFIVNYSEKLPSINRIAFTQLDDKGSLQITIQGDDTVIKYRMKWMDSLKTHLLTLLFSATNHITRLTLRKATSATLTLSSIQNEIGAVEVVYLSLHNMLLDLQIRKQVREIIRKNKTYSIAIYNREMYQDELSSFISTFPASVRTLFLEVKCNLFDEDVLYWDSQARDLFETKYMNYVRFESTSEIISYHCDPFLKYMRLFFKCYSNDECSRRLCCLSKNGNSVTMCRQ